MMPLSALLTREGVRFFCDFDGTISEQDMIGAVMMRFIPEQAEPIIAAVKAQRITVHEGVTAMFRLLPTRMYPDIVAFAQTHTVLRPGFDDFVCLCAEHGFAFTVVSGGFDFFVHPALQHLDKHIVAVHCNRLDTTGAFLDVCWDYPCDAACAGGCGLCKPSIVRRQRQASDAVIAVGDGVTDFKLAQQADYVFARDKLLAECRRIGVPHSAFNTFVDIAQVVREAIRDCHA